MTNQDLIIATAIENNIYTEDEIKKILQEKNELPFHTIMGWKERSPNKYEYRIKKGEHGVPTKLWKKKVKKDDNDSDKNNNYYLTKAFLFTEKQVELIPIIEETK